MPFLMLILAQGCVSTVSREYACAYHFMGDFAKKQHFENGLSVYGTGHSMPEGKIKELSLYFMAQRKLKVDEARILYISVTQQMLNQLNADPQLQFCLDHHPFTIDDLQVSIAFEEQSGKDVDPPYIAYVHMAKGIIHYVYYNSNTGLFYKADITEPYEKALHIVNSNTSINQSSMQLYGRLNEL